MSALDALASKLGAQPAAPAAEDLPDDQYLNTPEGMDSDYKKKHKNASIYFPLIDRYAKDYPDVPELGKYAKAVMLRESGGNADARSSAGAGGLFQFMPPTWKDMGGDPSKVNDPMENIPRGVKFLAQQYQDFGDWNEALAAYNWGPGNVASKGIDVLPHETANYLKAVNAYKRRLQPSNLESMFQNSDNPSPKMGMGSNFANFIASQTQKPSLDQFQQQGPINLDQGPQAVAKGLPALQPAPAEQGVEPQPQAPIPFTSVPPQLANFQPPQAPTPQQNLQATADRMPVGPEEFHQGVVKGIAQGATAGLYNPPIYDKQKPAAEMGRLVGGMAPMALGPLGGEAVAAGMASQAFLQNAKPDTEGKAGIENPIETTVQTVLASVLGSLGPGNIPNMGVRTAAGAGIGGAQAIASQVTQKIAQLASEGKVDPYNQEDVKGLATSMLQGAIFGVHGGEAGHAGPEIQHPGEMAMPLPEQKTFADKIADEALQNTRTRFTDYDPEGKREPPINVPQEGAAATPQGEPNAQREAFLKQAEQYLGPEKANAFKILMGEYLPGGKNASPYGVRLQNVDEVQAAGSANASDLNSKNSSSVMRNASNDNLANGGAGIPGTPEPMANEPSLRSNTWTGNRPMRHQDEVALENSESGIKEPVAMPENVPPQQAEVKPTPFALKDIEKAPDQIPTLREKVKGILQGRKIYIDDEARRQLGVSQGGARELGPIFTKDKQNGLTLDGVAELIREQAAAGKEFYRGFGNGEGVQANDIADALFSGNQEYSKPKSNEPEHVTATNDFLRNGHPDFEGATPTPARSLEPEFEAGGMKFKRIGTADKSRIAYKDEYGGKYDFSPDEVVHTGGEMKASEPSGEPAPANTPDENDGRLFQKDEEKKVAPTFYSQLRRTIESKMPNAAGPEAIKGLVKANGVKDEEMKWSGLDDLLKTKEGQKLSKQEVLDHLDQNQVEIKEVTKLDKQTARREDDEAYRKWSRAAQATDDYFDKIAEDHSTDMREWPQEYRDNWNRLKAEADKLGRARMEPQKPAKFDKYQEPGGQNYRELLLTLPGKHGSDEEAQGYLEDLYERLDGAIEEGNQTHAEYLRKQIGSIPQSKDFTSGHWEEPNVLAHVRFNDRMTPDGKSVLHIEEVQSDWHQAGRKKGYLEAGQKDEVPQGWGATGQSDQGNKVPDAPFKKTWHEMALRRMLRYAAENGYDYVSWTGGEKQADRYDLSKQISQIQYEEKSGTLVALDKRFSPVVTKKGVKPEELPDIIGKEAAEKIMQTKTNFEGLHLLEWPDLKMGGEGMRGFYDKMIPDYLSKYGKKWDSRVEKISTPTPKLTDEHFNIHDPQAAKSEFQALPVTDAMRKSVVEEGQPLFQGKMDQEIKGYTDFDPAKKEFVITLVNGKADVSTLFHEFFHTLEQGGVIAKADRAILTKAMQAHGITDALNSKGVFKEAAAEKLADWWERYLRDGKSPVKELQGVFDKVKNWMVEVYRSIQGTRLEGQVPHSVRQVFDRLIEGGRQAEGTLPEEGRLTQKSGKSPKPTEQMVGPDAPRNQKPATKEDFMVMEAESGNKESGYLTNPEKLLFGAADRAYPIKKIQAIYEKEFGLPVGSDQDLKYAINRIYGSAGTADEFINKNLAPAIEGGTINGQQFERLQPAESKRMFEYLLARDALWRYEHTEGYEMPNNLSKKMAEDIVQEHKALAGKNPAQYAKLEKSAEAMVGYARELAIKKLEMGLWTPEEFNEIIKNPNYVPEIRYWAKTLAAKKGGGAGLDFASRSKLVRGTQATSENVPVFDPLTSLIHDTHQLAKEGAKHYLGNAIIDMQESSPELQKLITEQEDDYKPKAHEGTFPVRRPRTTSLSPEQEKFAEQYQSAVWRLKAEEESGGTSKEDQILEQNRRKIKERVDALPSKKRQLLGNDVLDIVNRVEESRQKWKAKQLKEAQDTEAEFRALPPDQQKMIKRWMKEGKVTNYTVPAELAAAMSAMEPIQYGTIGKILKGTTSIFKKGTVTWNPAFAMVNGVRDVQEAYINTGMPPHYAFKGWRDFMTHSDLYHQYLERGGAIGNSESGFKGSTTRSSDLRYGRRLLRDRFNKVKDDDAWKNKTLKIGDKEFQVGKLARMAEAGIQAGKLPMEAMEAFGHMSEMSTRLGVMRYGMEKLGMNVDKAVDLARHATLDFDQRGASLNVQRAMDIVPFLNPRIQGTLRTGKRLMDGKQAVKTMTIGGLAPMLGLTALNMLNPNYANVSDRDKRYSWIIMIPGTDKHIAIPKPAVVQVLFNPFQMALEKAVGTTPTSLRQQALDNMQEILPVTDPSSILPPLAKVVLENKVNKDMFWNRPIVKEEGRESVDQYDPRTSQTMKSVAKKLQWLPNEVEWLKSPERLQHISKTMLGGTADNLLFLTDMLLGDAKKTLRSDYVPVVSRFYKGAEEWQSELSNKQRELMSEIKLKERSAGSSTEIQQTVRKGDKVDSEAMSERLHRTGAAMSDKFRELGEINKELARVRELVEAVQEHNPGVEYHFLRPPTFKKPATPAPSGATPEASPSPEDATVPSMSETESE